MATDKEMKQVQEWIAAQADAYDAVNDALQKGDPSTIIREYEKAVALFEDFPEVLAQQGERGAVTQILQQIKQQKDQYGDAIARYADQINSPELKSRAEAIAQGQPHQPTDLPQVAMSVQDDVPPVMGSAGAEGARELGKSVRGAQLTPEEMRMDPRAQERILASKRAMELQPAEGPLQKPASYDPHPDRYRYTTPAGATWMQMEDEQKQNEAAAKRARQAKGQDPSEYIMEAERPGSYDEPRISDRFKGSEGGLAGDEDDVFRSLLKGSRSDLKSEVKFHPRKFGFREDFDMDLDFDDLEDLSTDAMRTELTNRYLETGAERLKPLRFGGYRPEAGKVAESIAEEIAQPGATAGGIGEVGMDFAVESRAFERMVNAAKEAGIAVGDDVLKVAKGLGKIGLKVAGPIGLGITGYDVGKGIQEDDPARIMYALAPGLPGGGAHAIGAELEDPHEMDEATRLGEETKADIIEGHQSPYHQKLQQDIDRQEQVSGWLKEGVPMHEIRRRVSSGALAREEEPLVPLGPTGPSIKAAE